MFATRADLLARSNARRLVQFAVPADVTMVPDEALRIAINGGDISGYSAQVQASLALALSAIDKALGDASELLVSYGIPDTAQSALLARMASTVALYYLHGASATQEVQRTYDGVLATLKSHARGEIDLVPTLPGSDVAVDDIVVIESGGRRYGA